MFYNDIQNILHGFVLEKLAVAQTVKKFPLFYGTERFITKYREPATGICLELDDSCSLRYVLILSYRLTWSILSIRIMVH
jgi:hypothetical protein